MASSLQPDHDVRTATEPVSLVPESNPVMGAPIFGGPSLTMRVTVVVRTRAPTQPVIVSVYVPVGVGVPQSDGLSVSVAVVSHAGFGPNVAVVPAGRPSTSSDTGDLVALQFRPMPNVVLWPRSTVWQPGAAETNNGAESMTCQSGEPTTSPPGADRRWAGQVPFARIVAMDLVPESVRPANTIRVPSGDQCGCEPANVAPVSFSKPVPLEFTV